MLDVIVKHCQVVVRSKAHGVTREGKLVQPSVKMEKCPLDWGAEQVRKAKKSKREKLFSAVI